MKEKQDPGRQRRRKRGPQPAAAVPSGPVFQRPGACAVFAFLLGLVLGLCILKFGNPVVLDQKIPPPTTLAEAWSYAWPPHWTRGIVLSLLLAATWVAVAVKSRWPAPHWLWILPVSWFGWQLISATHSVDSVLTATAVWQFAGCLVCYFAGALLVARQHALRWLLIGLLAAFTFCLVRAVDQKLFEFPIERQLLLEGEHTGWTNFSPEVFLQMKQDNVVITTNGVDVVNPAFLVKYTKARVMGTLVYPNALAGLILLLGPVSLVLAFQSTRRFRVATRMLAILLTLFLVSAGLFWTGSKLGWLIAVLLAGTAALRWDRLGRWKYAATIILLAGGLAVFFIRFHGYFAAGATSVGARFDYWHAAVQITTDHPATGSGPGTFQRPYALIKSPESEMARLVHNDYLEQFSDSGIPGGLSYGIWVLSSLALLAKRLWIAGSSLVFAVYLGVGGWFAQGLGEFNLYIPALAWSAFTLLGWLTAVTANQIDKSGGPTYNSLRE